LDIIEPLKKFHADARYMGTRDELIDFLNNILSDRDVVLLMGARDPSLAGFAKYLFQNY